MKRKDQIKELFNRYYASLVVYARRYIEDLEVRKDIVSDVFARVWMKPESFVLEEETAPLFLKVSVRNACLNWLSRRTGREIPAVPEIPSYAESPDTLYTLEELNALLDEALSALPEPYRGVFEESILGDRPEKEVAKELGISTRSVERYRARIRTLLESALGDYLPPKK